MQKILDAYSFFGLEKRTKLFRWVLGQIPLNLWEDQLGKSKFIEEADELESLKKATLETFDRLAAYANHFKKQFNREVLIETIAQKIKEAPPQKPLFQYIQEGKTMTRRNY